MKLSPAVLRSLAAMMEHDLDAIARLDSVLQNLVPALSSGADYRDLATTGYALHNLYNAFENSFDQISRTFENHVVDQAQWHRELLDKMFLTIPEVRPPVLSDNLRKLMQELRGFRHLFRHGYDFELDRARLLSLIEQWNTAKTRAIEALRAFIAYLRAEAQQVE